jgi:PEP-CTERM motif-containing protein
MKVEMRWNGSARLLAAVLLAAGLAVSANAETVLVDFGSATSFRGVTVPAPDAKGHFWNSLTPGPFFPSLVDINNNPTSVALGYDTPVGTDSFNGPAGATTFPNPTPAEIAATDIDTVALGDLGIKEAAIDFAASPGGNDNRTRFQIQGLNPNEKYTLTIFGSHKFSTDDATVYSIYSDNTYSTLVASTSLNVQTPGSPNLHNRDQVATLSNLSPQASNILYVQFIGAGGNLGYLNSFKLQGVPEPSSFILMAGGAAALVFGWRRRR